jgi:hypothetical protein
MEHLDVILVWASLALALTSSSFCTTNQVYSIVGDTVFSVYTGQKNLYGRDRKNSGIKRVPVYESLLSYKLSLFSFAEPSDIRREMYVFRYNQVRYKQRIL